MLGPSAGQRSLKIGGNSSVHSNLCNIGGIAVAGGWL